MTTRTPWNVTFGEEATYAKVVKHPAGWVGYASVTSNQTGITTEAAVSGLTVSPTVASNRLIKVTVCTHVKSDNTGDRILVRVKADGTTLQTFRVPDCVANLADTAHFSVFHAPSSGTVAYTVTVERSSGSGSVTVEATSTSPATLLVEDTGASS